MQSCFDMSNSPTNPYDNSPTNHLPVYAIIRGIIDPSEKEPKDNTDEVKWGYIDDRKKEKFLNILADKLSTIDLNGHPENILLALTEKTQEARDLCFEEKLKI